MAIMNNALIIFARDPVPGQVKTRLAASISNHAAAELYSAMLQDVLKSATMLHNITPIIFWANETIPELEYLPTAATSYLQSDGDLGKRMAHAFDTAFSTGFDSCCIIGSDAPGLPADYIVQAFKTLEYSQLDVVFGPATDGGYYLIGMRRVQLPLFNDIPWSCQQTLEKSCQKASDFGITYALLPEWQDIDTLDDLNSTYLKGMRRESETCKAIERLLPLCFQKGRNP